LPPGSGTCLLLRRCAAHRQKDRGERILAKSSEATLSRAPKAR
jgi:hypothetical protein